MTKQEKIKEVYGKYYNEWKSDINENGVLETTLSLPNIMVSELSLLKQTMCTYVPFKLQGIENNNGWIKIEIEKDLPSEDVEYKVGTLMNDKFYLSDGVYDFKEIKFSYQNKYITHYQPIIKPLNPIY